MVFGGATLLLSILAGGAAACLFGIVVGVPCLRLKGDYLAIATLGFAEIFRVLVINIDAVGGPRGFDLPNLLFARTKSERVAYYALYFALALGLLAWTVVVMRNIMRSSHGRAIYAIREDEVAAEILGVDLTQYKVWVFIIGAGFAGLAGGLWGNMKTYFAPNDFSLLFGVVLLLYVVLGGLGSIWGCIVATFTLYVLERALAQLQTVPIPFLGDPAHPVTIGTWWQVIFALMLVVIVIARPQGIVGKKSV
jgi:branched-chain amino acid transport system permease protein